ncbi:toxin-antitoxin system [Rhodococcus sp. NPDC127530]|uniref:toxin-antitoxin system n=1 Tax=unclassified Rhodococcus (in: high G+C Gram-positive bacteria) TaxID=192944 RepID=UPI003629ED0E
MPTTSKGSHAKPGRPSLGDRKRLGRVPDELYDLLDSERKAHGVKSVSQYVSDLLALRAGRPDLVRELNLDQEVLPLTA